MESIQRQGEDIKPKATYSFRKRQFKETMGEAVGKQLYSLATQYGVPQEFFDKVVETFNHYIKGYCKPLLSYHLTKKVRVIAMIYINTGFRM